MSTQDTYLRFRRIQCAALALVLREMGIDPEKLDDPIEQAFDEEVTSEESLPTATLSDDELMALCRKQAIASAPLELKRRHPAVIDHDDPGRNLYGCTPCPRCQGRYRFAFAATLRIRCDDCGHEEQGYSVQERNTSS